MSEVLQLWYSYEFLKRFAVPFKYWKAFKLGVIDENGNVLVKRGHRTLEQNNAFGNFDHLVLNLKKLLATFPYGSSRFATYAAALVFFLKESESHYDDVDFLKNKIEENVHKLKKKLPKTFKEFVNEDAPANAVGSGANVAGLTGNPPVNKIPGKNFEILRRKKLMELPNKTSFIVANENNELILLRKTLNDDSSIFEVVPIIEKNTSRILIEG